MLGRMPIDGRTPSVGVIGGTLERGVARGACHCEADTVGPSNPTGYIGKVGIREE